MEEFSQDLSSIEKHMENLVLTSKSYVNRRGDEEIELMRSNIEDLNQSLDSVMERVRDRGDVTNLTLLKSLRKITAKLHSTVDLLEGIKSHKPCFRDYDIPNMVDILLDNIRSLIHYHPSPRRLSKVKSDMQTVEMLEEQHKRVLLTFLMQDWDNLNQVLSLMKVGEIYKSIAEELVNISLFMDAPEEQ